MTVGSLFSGAGGFDMGFHAVGFELAWLCEIDSQCRDVLRRHFPGVPLYSNVKEVSGATLAPVDVLIFGSPCQDLSIAGLRAGLDGGRSGLFFQAMRIVDEMASPPRVAVWENVSGALSSHNGEDFATVLTAMGQRWSGIAYRVLDLQYFGVPQRRRRVFVVGHSGGWECAAAVLFEREGVRWNTPKSRKAREDVAASLTRSLGRRGGQPDGGDTAGQLIAFGGGANCNMTDVPTALTAHPGGRYDAETETFVAHTLRGEGFDASEDGTGRGTPLVPVAFRHWASASDTGAPQEDVAPSLRSADTMGLSVTLTCGDRGISVDQAAAGMIQPVALNLRGRDEGARAEFSDVASLRASSGGSSRSHVATYTAVRRLTPTECMRLQGWPDDWCKWGLDEDGRRVEMSDSAQYRMAGNGVGKPHALWLAKRIMSVDAGLPLLAGESR